MGAVAGSAAIRSNTGRYRCGHGIFERGGAIHYFDYGGYLARCGYRRCADVGAGSQGLGAAGGAVCVCALCRGDYRDWVAGCAGARRVRGLRSCGGVPVAGESGTTASRGEAVLRSAGGGYDYWPRAEFHGAQSYSGTVLVGGDQRRGFDAADGSYHADVRQSKGDGAIYFAARVAGGRMDRDFGDVGGFDWAVRYVGSVGRKGARKGAKEGAGVGPQSSQGLWGQFFTILARVECGRVSGNRT